MLIYTKLNQADCPFQKKDFHTAFYPVDFLTKTEQLVIENFIFIPDIENFVKKQVVYFREFKEEMYMFVLDIKAFPDEVDEFGRKGIFLCHVFMFPEKLWQQLSQPNKLLQLLEKYTFNSRKQILESPLINKQTGNIQPIEVTTEDIDKIEKTFQPIDNEADKFVLKYFFDGLEEKNQGFKLVYKARENIANILFNKMICYLPNSQKHLIGWDTSYEGGRMMDFSIPLASYEQKSPKGGDQILAVQGSSKITVPEKFKKTEVELEKPFVKWVLFSSATINSFEIIEQGLLLAKTLETGIPEEITELNWDISTLCIANQKLLDKRFDKKCSKDFDRKISALLSKVMSPADKMYFILDKIQNSKITDYLVEALQQKKISHRRLRKNISQDYIDKSPILLLVQKLWEKNYLDVEIFNKLTDDQKMSLNKYIINTKWLNSKPYLSLVRENSNLMNYFINRYKKPKRIIKYFISNFRLSSEEINKLGFYESDIDRILTLKIKKIFKRKKK